MLHEHTPAATIQDILSAKKEALDEQFSITMQDTRNIKAEARAGWMMGDNASQATPILLGNDVLVPQEASISLSKGTAKFRCPKSVVSIRSTRALVFVGVATPATARTAKAFTINAGYQARVPIVLVVTQPSACMFL
jgi:hypothetical protein